MNEKTEEKPLTPKQKYDQEIKGYNKSIAENTAPEKEVMSEQEVKEHLEEVDALEEAIDSQDKIEAIDKNMGATKIEVTKQQHLSRKLEEEKKKVLSTLHGPNASMKQNKLAPKDVKLMDQVLVMIQNGKCNDPVLKHLVDKKVSLAGERATLLVKIKEAQLRIINEMATMTDESMKNQGAMDTYNKDILQYVRKNPELLDDGHKVQDSPA